MIVFWPDIVSAEGYTLNKSGWVKRLLEIDVDKPGGYSYLGPFVSGSASDARECPEGLYLACVMSPGPDEKPVKTVAIFRLQADNCRRESDWVKGDDWALRLQDQALALLKKKTNPLEMFRTEDLLEELQSRGVSIATGIREKVALAKQQRKY